VPVGDNRRVIHATLRWRPTNPRFVVHFNLLLWAEFDPLLGSRRYPLAMTQFEKSKSRPRVAADL
jgi:hypothetical protein